MVLDIAASLISRLLHIDVAFWLNTCGEKLVPRSRAVASHGAAKSERRSQINGGQKTNVLQSLNFKNSDGIHGYMASNRHIVKWWLFYSS
jgi:hypothetical protein